MSHSDHETLHLFVKRLLHRSVLSLEEQQAVLDLPCRAAQARSRQDFVHENQHVSYSCYIASGMVGRYSQTIDGRRQVTAFHRAGDMVDLHSAVRPVGVGGFSALCDTTVLQVPHDAIRKLAARYPALAEAFWRDCMLETAILMQWVVNVGQRDAKTRLAHILCEMAIRSGEDYDILTDYDFPITQAQLGEAVALTSVHVNRSLRRLTMDGFVTFQRGRVQIHDWKGLVAAGEFDPAYLLADTGPDRQKRLLTDE